MKIEIATEGSGKGTIVTLDGDRLSHVCSVNLAISADGFPVLLIERLAIDGELLAGEVGSTQRCLRTAILKVEGRVVFEGEAIAITQNR